YSVLTAENGAQAIEIYTRDRSKIAAVLTDMIMPVMDGAALIKALRDIDPSVPVIAASGRTAPNQLAEVKDNQSVRFLSKPYSAELMLGTLFQTLAATHTPLLNRGKQHV
ncbi:MAG TPA: response regulator, partial [Thermoanaerobaculia bacterium]